MPDERLAFHDETGEVREEHEALFRFAGTDGDGLQIEGGSGLGLWHANAERLAPVERRFDVCIRSRRSLAARCVSSSA